MPLPYWGVERVKIDVEGWGYSTAFMLTCSRCKHRFVVPRAWSRQNIFGTAPCPFCFKSSRIPKPRKRSV